MSWESFRFSLRDGSNTARASSKRRMAANHRFPRGRGCAKLGQVGPAGPQAINHPLRPLSVPALAFVLLGSVLAFAAFFYGGVLPQYWNPCLLALGAAAAILWLSRGRGELAPPLPRLQRRLLMALIAVVVLQVVPLPVGMLKLMSPARAETLASMGPVTAQPSFATLSALPSGTMAHVLRVFAYLVVLLAVRQILWMWRATPWLLPLPIVIVAVLEAALGITQSYLLNGDAAAHGTYVNRNHFAGLLELALPFAVVYPMALLKRNSGDSRFVPALLASGAWACATVLLIGILFSLSRMGFVAALFGLAVIGLLAARDTFARGPSRSSRRTRRSVILAGLFVGTAVLLAFAFFPSDALIQRFAGLATAQEVTAEGRLQLWQETLHLVTDYPFFGVGLGAYGTVFQKYKVSAPMVFDDNAHNDYLQVLSETGFLGFGLCAIFVTLILWNLLSSLGHSDLRARCLAIACLGSLAAILLHSFVDHNLYMPANAMAVAWVCGIGLGLNFIPENQYRYGESG